MSQATVIVIIDGLDPAYLQQWDTPNLRELGRKGFMKLISALMPTVTNVNNVSVATGCYPAVHGIPSNYWLDRESGRELYLESADHIQAETLFQRAQRLGRNSVLVTAKDKLRSLMGAGATLAISSEQPPGWLVKAVGEPPPVYSLEVNGWVVRAAAHLLARQPVEVAYVATTDYPMHLYPPEAPQSGQHLRLLDQALGQLVETHPSVRLLITADHGMSPKTRMVDLGAALRRYGIEATAVPIIKDRYVLHHSNLGGATFLYLDQEYEGQALDVLRHTKGVDEALGREEAAVKYQLPYDRIGDILVLGAQDVVFGDPAQVSLPPNLRSHGSLHETKVPIIGYGDDFSGFTFEENRDIGRYVLERVLR